MGSAGKKGALPLPKNRFPLSFEGEGEKGVRSISTPD